MNRLKGYLVAGAAILILSGCLYFMQEKVKKQKAEIRRLESNNSQLMQDSAEMVKLIIKEREITGRTRRERDSLAKLLSIKPKVITEYREKIVTQEIRVPVPVPVYRLKDSSYIVKDYGPCFKYEGLAVIEQDSMSFTRLLFDYRNKVFDIFYFKRKFPLVGRKVFYHESRAECGGVTTREVKIERR